MRSNLATISPGISSFAPPAEPLTDIFTPEVLGNWRAKRTEEIERRLEILEAHGPYPDDCYSAADLRFLIARKAAWHTYLYSAFACGMFEGVRGAELRSRLIGRDAANFRSAMAECLTCWFLAGKMR